MTKYVGRIKQMRIPCPADAQLSGVQSVIVGKPPEEGILMSI